MDKYESTPLHNAPFMPLIDCSQPKPKRQSNMVAAYRWFSVVVIVGFVFGLYWRLA